ncbi:MAG: 16S rRNA (guanine(966)-N(2))-methyltransferase RsmD [Bdellovibrionales bacterium]
MRIISGKFKGHHLISFQAQHIRPTTDRVKETLFNKINFEAHFGRALDLFCGTGNLGLEALSRGAEHVTFVDSHKQSIQITRENIIKLKVTKEESTVIQKDVLTYLKQYSGDPFDLIFADPPFTQKMAHDVMLALSTSQAVGLQTVITIESERKERMENQYAELIRYDHREFGDKILSFFRKQSQIHVGQSSEDESL